MDAEPWLCVFIKQMSKEIGNIILWKNKKTPYFGKQVVKGKQEQQRPQGNMEEKQNKSVFYVRIDSNTLILNWKGK